MKKLVYRAYDGICFGCNRRVRDDERSIDHIQPFSKAGQTELMNLQLLCKPCNGAIKEDSAPKEEHFTLHFPLVPPPSDSYPGLIW